MRYVLVPVPADLVLEVMRWVLFRTVEEERDHEIDRVRVAEFLAGADERTWRLVSLVAAATTNGVALRLRDAIDESGMERAEAQALIDDLNGRVLEGGRELLETWDEIAVGVDGQRGTHGRIAMRDDLARVVRTSERTRAG